MLFPRVIPCLLLDDGGLVKSVRFRSSPIYVGDPINAIRIFNEKSVDELIILDVGATRARREPDYAYIEQIASECFMPVCYGGGITSVGQAKRLVSLGIEKVAVNHAAIQRSALVYELARELGSQSVVAAIDVKKEWLGRRPRVFDSARRTLTDIDPVVHAERLVAEGAGEVFVNNVDRDGTLQGYDLDLVRSFTSRLKVPVIACGGAWTQEHLRAVVKDAGASAAAAGSMFVFQGPNRAVLINYPQNSDLEKVFGD